MLNSWVSKEHKANMYCLCWILTTLCEKKHSICETWCVTNSLYFHSELPKCGKTCSSTKACIKMLKDISLSCLFQSGPLVAFFLVSEWSAGGFPFLVLEVCFQFHTSFKSVSISCAVHKGPSVYIQAAKRYPVLCSLIRLLTSTMLTLRDLLANTMALGIRLTLHTLPFMYVTPKIINSTELKIN